jgi:hypothetical protein
VLSPLVLERGYSAASLSQDNLSKQRQEYICNMGAALRALQQVRHQAGCAASRMTPPSAGPCLAPHASFSQQR